MGMGMGRSARMGVLGHMHTVASRHDIDGYGRGQGAMSRMYPTQEVGEDSQVKAHAHQAPVRAWMVAEDLHTTSVFEDRREEGKRRRRGKAGGER
jgi:hypothetical protein